jgi:hypothetical protein
VYAHQTQRIFKVCTGLLRRQRTRGREIAFLGDWQLTLGDYLSIIIALLVIAAFLGLATFFQVRFSRSECARLRKEVGRLSEDIKHLVNAEQRRFLKELNSPQKEEDSSKASE